MDANPLLWLRPTRKPGAGAFATLFALDSFARASIITVLYLQAKDLAVTDRHITLFTNMASVSSLTFSFLVPFLIHRFRRRWVYTAGIGLGMAAAVALASASIVGEAAALILRALSSVAISTGLLLYVMDFIPRNEMIRSEPLRLFSGCLPWGLGPWIGVQLYDRFGPTGVAALSIGAYVVLLGYFWYLRITENPAVAAAKRPPPNPFSNLARFVRQPRLRLAWFIAFARSSWWSMFFVYPTLYLHDNHVDNSWAGALTGAGNIMLLLTLPVGWLARRTGIRRLIMTAFTAAGLLTLGAAATFKIVPVTGCLILAGTAFVVWLDALGTIPFMRSVRSYERTQMASVFQTYIYLSDLLPGIVYFVLLGFFDLRSIFITCGLLAIVGGVVATRLPKSM
jgi:MFS family permease